MTADTRVLLALGGWCLLATGCGEPGTAVESRIAVTLEASRLTVAAGEVRSFLVTVDDGVEGREVDLNLLDAPEGVTAAFQSSGPSDSIWTLTIRADPNTVPGEYQVTVRATSASASGQEALTLMVTPAASGFSVAVSASALLFAPGDSAKSVVTIVRHNFSGQVRLELHGAPAGLQWSFTPDSTAGFASTLTLHVGSGIPPGLYECEVWGTSTVGENWAPLRLTVLPAPNFQIALQSPRLVVAAGASDRSVVTIARTNFSGHVQLRVRSAPPDVQGVFNPDSTAGSESRLTVTVGAAVPPGEYAIEVEGVSTLGSRLALLSLTVPRPPEFEITVLPASLVAAPGSSAQAEVTLTRHGYTGIVNLEVRRTPPGMTWSLNPSSTSGDSSTLSFAIGAAVPPGEYPVQVFASGTQDTMGASLHISVATSNPDFTLLLELASATLSSYPVVRRGIGVTLARAPGYAEPIALSVSQWPPWLHWEFDPASTVGTTSTLYMMYNGNLGRTPSGCGSVTVVGTHAMESSSSVIRVCLRGPPRR